MKYRYVLYILIIVVGLVQAQMPQVIFRANWGNKSDQVALRQAPEANYGPQAFRIVNDKIAILDQQNRSLKMFSSGELQQSFPVSSFSRDFVFTQAESFTVLSDDHLQSFEQGKQVDSRSIGQGGIIQSLHQLPSGQEWVQYSNGGQLNIRTGNNLQKNAATMQLTRDNAGKASVKLQTGSGQKSLSIEVPDKNLASLQFVGMDNQEHLFLQMEFFIQQVPLKVERQVWVYNTVGEHILTYGIPLNNYTLIFRDLELDAQGNLYQMLQLPDAFKIIKWEFPVLPDKLPLDFDTPEYNWNQLDKPIDEYESTTLSKTALLLDVTPDQALAIADTYVQLRWDCAAINLTDGKIQDPNGQYVETPGWLFVGEMQRVPYKWGGFNTIDGFLDGISTGKFSGDKATEDVSSYAVGVDCSGFVSRCWMLSSHYSTRMMDDYITQPYESWEQTQPGDACHKVGHVRLIVAHNPDGSLDMVEAAGFNWRVSYTNFRYSQITDYTPRYYINMQGVPGNIPQPKIEYVLFQEQSQLKWSVSDTETIDEFHLYMSADGLNWNDERFISPDSSSFSETINDTQAVYFKLKSISSSDGSTESLPSDGYGIYRNDRRQKVLIVDAFDRTSSSTGSWGHTYHDFSVTHARALQVLKIPFETVPNEAVINGFITLDDYAAVIWISGDESTADETFNSSEQNLINTYLKQGGQLFVSGSEIGWDLDYKGETADRSFYNNFLKADYVEDDAGSYTVNGSDSLFAGLVLHYDDGSHGVYQEDYPDAIKAVNGSQNALTYANGKIAAVHFSGMFDSGTDEGKLFYMAFPFETIYNESERFALMAKIMDYFDIPEIVTIETSQPIAAEFVLYGNYPNPFNGQTKIRFSSPTTGKMNFLVYDILGRLKYKKQFFINELGEQKIDLIADNWGSGTYFYKIVLNSSNEKYQASGKFILIK